MRTAVAAPAPENPYQLLADALRAYELAQLELEIESPNVFRWARIPGMIQLRMAVWDPERGWLTCRTSILHRDRAFVDVPLVEESVAVEARVMVRAILHRWNEP